VVTLDGVADDDEAADVDDGNATELDDGGWVGWLVGVRVTVRKPPTEVMTLTMGVTEGVSEAEGEGSVVEVGVDFDSEACEVVEGAAYSIHEQRTSNSKQRDKSNNPLPSPRSTTMPLNMNMERGIQL
jgi:hypothetical protein